jgi:hypothetical protein
MVESAVRLHVPEPGAATRRDGGEHVYLLLDEPLDLVEARCSSDAAEGLSVGISGMRADRGAVAECCGDARLHRGLVSRVPAAGDVGGGDDLHERFVGAVPDRVGALAEIAVEIDRLQSSTRPRVSGRSSTAIAPRP